MQQTSKTFDLGPTSTFYEGNIATWSRFYCARQYNKDNTDKFCIGLFVMADSTHFFVRHIDVYQVNDDDEFYRGDQILQHSAGFSAQDHFKKWYKRGHLGIFNFDLLNSGIPYNLSCESMVHRGK